MSTQAKLTNKQLEKLHEETAVAVTKKTSCSTCSVTDGECQCSVTPKTSTDEIVKADAVDTSVTAKDKSNEVECQSKQKTSGNETMPKRRLDVITSFTDSPLFTRKHRFGNRNNGDTASPTFARRNDHGFSLVKQLTEGRWRRKDPKNASTGEDVGKQAANCPNQTQEQRSSAGSSENRNNDNAVEATPVESRASVSLHTQVSYDTSREK